MIYKCQICGTKPLTAWVILKWSLFTRCWTLIYKQRVFEIFICGIFLDDICFSAFCLNICKLSFERESKQLEKSFLMYAFISYPVKSFVCKCSCCIKEWKKERMKSYVLNDYHQSLFWKNIYKKQLFSWKKQLFFEKKLSTSEMKKLLHP